MVVRAGRPPRPRLPMTLKEIRELLLLKEWSRTELGNRLGISLNTIDRWFCVREDQRRHPSPEHVEQMGVWLDEAREQSRSERHQPAAAAAS